MFKQQPGRKLVVCLGLTMNHLELIFVRQGAFHAFTVSHMGPVAFSLDCSSLGFPLLVRFLSSPRPAQLGFVRGDMPQLPALRSDDGTCWHCCEVHMLQAAVGSCGGYVFDVKAASTGRRPVDDNVKLCADDREVSFAQYLCTRRSRAALLLYFNDCHHTPTLTVQGSHILSAARR